jgi:hypothetical protein
MKHARAILGSAIFADRAIGNLQQWLIGTYRGVSRNQLQVYLDEFVFRHNHAGNPWPVPDPCSAFATGRKPTAYKQIRGAVALSPRPTTPDPNLLRVAETTRINKS